MSKKKRAPDPRSVGEIVEARVIEEREWAYAAWMDRLSWGAMRALANQPREKGGLGRDVSPGALRNLVREARAMRGDLGMSREERAERALYEVDEVIRSARRSIASAAAVGALDVHASKLLLDAGKREGEIVGYFAAQRIEAEVIHRDAVLEELNAALVAMGEEPVKS
jgi:hypothetical protein